jgi:DNA-binding transcriptional ArsR family regulator
MSASQPLDESLIKAVAHPLRWRMLEVLTERGEASPVQLARALDQPLATVSHHMRVLRDTRCVQLTRTEPRRGAVEHYYEPLRRPTAHVDRMFVELDDRGRRELSDLLNDVVREAQAIQARSDARHGDTAGQMRISEIALLHFEPVASGELPNRSPAVATA